MISRGLWALCLVAVLLFSPLVKAGDGGALPLGRGQGGLSTGPDAVEAVRRLSREFRARSETVDRREFEQVFVVPQRPGRNNVRYYDFDWRRYDYLDRDGVGGVRLYYYRREAERARMAAAMVRDQYERLSERFHYRPSTRVPYILYNSHREFENTNVFFVSEGVLGVTSPMDLRMALPYWGERQRFREVSTHEMAHQFTIQKASDRAAQAGVDSTIGSMPLWFIEGLAEFYAKDGIDAETRLFARDLLLNPRPERGYGLVGFWDDLPGSFIHTYKLGQLRVAFLAEQYGESLVQGILDQSPRLAGPRGSIASDSREAFPDFVARLAREKPDAIAQRFTAWLRRRSLPEYLAATQEPPAIPPVELEGEPDAFSTGPDPQLVLYRAVERESGRSRLMLVDRRDPSSVVRVAQDGEPGVESLHPVLRRVTAVGRDHLAFVARSGASDVLYVVPFSRLEEGKRVRLDVGARRRIELASSEIVEAGDPAFSPDGSKVAFFALDLAGRIDVWTAEIATGRLVRVTDDAWAERDLHWSSASPEAYGIENAGAEGTILFATDRTTHGHYNLAALDPTTGRTRRLTDEPADHRAPWADAEGRVVFTSDAKGKPDLHRLDVKTGRAMRITDFVTGLQSPSGGPRGLMAIGFYGGQFRVFDVPTQGLLDLDARVLRTTEPADPPAPSEEPIPPEAAAYDPWSLENWRLENGVAALGTYSVGQGALLFGDVLSDRNLLVQLAVYGSPRLTDASAFFLDKVGRKSLGVGLFHTFTQRRDNAAPGFLRDVFYLQREFGLAGVWSWPFDAFTRIEAHLVAQGLEREFQYPIDTQGFVETAVDLGQLREWNATHGGYDLEGLASVRLGYDTTRFRFPGGAFAGGSALIEAGGGWLPLRAQLHTFATIDLQHHWRFFNTFQIHLRAAGGASGGSVFGRQFFLSSYDNLRGYSVSDRRLIGRAYVVTNADLTIPLDALIRLAFATNVEGLVGLDAGSIASEAGQLWAGRVLDWVLGFNLGLGAIQLRFHFARNIDIGAPVPNTGWVPNISLRYASF